jgi:hypothetical protein
LGWWAAQRGRECWTFPIGGPAFFWFTAFDCCDLLLEFSVGIITMARAFPETDVELDNTRPVWSWMVNMMVGWLADMLVFQMGVV